jgi:hypothetical protein
MCFCHSEGKNAKFAFENGQVYILNCCKPALAAGIDLLDVTQFE